MIFIGYIRKEVMNMKSSSKRILYTLLVSGIIVYSSSFAILMTLERMDYRNYLQGEYSKNIYELIDSIQNIGADLGKASISKSKEGKGIIFQEIYRNSAMANDNLHSLPLPQPVIDGTSRLLSQVGDFCFSLVVNSSENEDIKEEDYNNIIRLKKQSEELLQNLNSAAEDINKGKVKWGEIRKKTYEVFAKEKDKSIENKFGEIQKQVVSYPALIYDGPFSDNNLSIKPKILLSKEIKEETAKEIVQKSVSKDEIEQITLASEDGSNLKSDIPTFRYMVKMKGRDEESDIIIEISKNGGKILYLLDERNVGQPKITKEDAMKKGIEYLNKLGYKNMEESYASLYENQMVISYIYKEKDVAIYTDGIKLKIAMDDGSIIGIESDKYLTSHIDKRDNLTPKISKDEAIKLVSDRLKLIKWRMAIIPTEMNKEVLCYEFYGKFEDGDYIVYINALTGKEQKILQIIHTENGELTI